MCIKKGIRSNHNIQIFNNTYRTSAQNIKTIRNFGNPKTEVIHARLNCESSFVCFTSSCPKVTAFTLSCHCLYTANIAIHKACRILNFDLSKSCESYLLKILAKIFPRFLVGLY